MVIVIAKTFADMDKHVRIDSCIVIVVAKTLACINKHIRMGNSIARFGAGIEGKLSIRSRALPLNALEPGIVLAWYEYTFADVAGGPDFGAPESECA